MSRASRRAGWSTSEPTRGWMMSVIGALIIVVVLLVFPPWS